MTINQEQTLIQEIVSGNTKAYAQFVEKYKGLVFTLTLRMLKNREEAEEVAQDVFVKSIRSLSSFKGDSKLSTWVYRIAYNTCLDRIKRTKIKYVEVEINEFTENKLKSIDNALEHMIGKEREQLVRKCIDMLPSDDGFIMTLYYYEELSLEEISKIVDLTPNNIKVRLFRSRKKLASILKQNLEPELLDYYERERR